MAEEKTKLEKLEEQIKTLQERKNLLLQQEKAKDRKQRTKRLIEIGATIESRLNFNSKESAEALCEYLLKFPDNFEKIKNFVEKRKKEIAEEGKKKSGVEKGELLEIEV